MIYGSGIDIIEVSRIKAVMDRDIGFREKIFTAGEIAYCETKKHKYEKYHERFAAKEAFLKALGTGLREGISWQDMEVSNDALGKPVLKLSGKAAEFSQVQKVTRIHLSLSHDSGHAVAMVDLESL